MKHFVCYFQNDTYFEFVRQKESYKLSRIEKPRIIQIVSRQYYQERHERFAISDKKSLKKVLSLKTYSCSDNLIFARVSRVLADFSFVNFWHVKLKSRKSLFYIPESFLLCQEIENGEVLDLDNDGFFYTKYDEVIFSSPKNSLFKNAMTFTQSVGVTMLKELEITNDEKLQRLVRGVFFPSVLKDLSLFLKYSKSSDIHAGFKKSVFICMSVFITYFMISSVFIYTKNQGLESKLSQQKELVGIALQLEQEKLDKSTLLAKRRELLKSLTIVSPIAIVLKETIVTANITSINLTQGRFVVKGDASKATELLDILLKISHVSDAKFDLPIRSYRNREEFVISFVLNSDKFTSNYATAEEKVK